MHSESAATVTNTVIDADAVDLIGAPAVPAVPAAFGAAVGDGAVTAVLARITRSGAWSIIAHGAGAAGAFAATVVVGRVLGPADLGRYSVALWVLTVVPVLIALGMPTALTKFTAEGIGEGGTRGRGALRFVLNAHVAVSALVGVVVGAVALTGRLSPALAGILGAGVAVTLLGLDLDAFLTGLGRFRALAAIGGAIALVQVGLTAAGAAFGVSWVGFVALYLAAGAVQLGVMGVIARRGARHLPTHRFGAADRSRLVRFSVAVSLAVVVDAVVWGRPELAFLQRLRDDTEVGLYSAALRLASLAAFLPLVAARPLLPEFSALRGGGRLDELRSLYPRVCAVTVALTAPLALGGAATARATLGTLFGPSYTAATGTAVILFLGALVAALAGPTGAAVLTGPRPRLIAEVGVVAAVLNVALDLVLIPPFGAVGAAAATVAVQVGAVLFGVTYCWRRLGLRFPIGAALHLLGLAAGVAVVAGSITRVRPGALGLATAVAVSGTLYVAALLTTGPLRLRRPAR